jgi:hypothetical protein
LIVDHLDQAALRALLIMLWDAGQTVVSVASETHRAVRIPLDV